MKEICSADCDYFGLKSQSSRGYKPCDTFLRMPETFLPSELFNDQWSERIGKTTRAKGWVEEGFFCFLKGDYLYVVVKLDAFLFVAG